MRRLLRDDDGAIAPAIMLFMIGLVAASIFFLRQALASTIAAEADTAADAAALGGIEILDTDRPPASVVAGLLTPGGLPSGLEAAADAEAATWAARNGADFIGGELRRAAGEDALLYTVRVRSDEDIDGQRAVRTSTARLEFVLVDGGDGGACMTVPATQAVIAAARVGGRHPGAASSGLVQCNGTNTVGLDPRFKEAFVAAEANLGGRIPLSSAFRSSADQARLYAAYQDCLATGSTGCTPAAPPGSSLHEVGRAIDVPGSFSLTLQGAIARTGMCYPDIADDPFHFIDCRGRSGLPPGNAFGLITFDDPYLVAQP